MKKITEKREKEFNDLADELFNNIFSQISKKLGVEDILSPSLVVDRAFLREGFIKLDNSFVEELISLYAETYFERLIGIVEEDVDELLCNYTKEEIEKEIACFFFRRFIYNSINRIIILENWDLIESCPILFEDMRLFFSQMISKGEEKLLEEEKV